MTPTATPEALAENLRKSLAMAANDPGNVLRADGTKVGYKGDRCMGGWIADAILAGPLAPLLAALQQVTAERDETLASQRYWSGEAARAAEELAKVRAELAEAQADQRAAEDSNDALNVKLHTLAPHGSCACSYDKPGDVCLHHSPALATATAEAASLRAEVEAVLDDATRMSSLLLMAGEMTAQERRTARAVAEGIAAKIRTALARAATAGEG